MSTQSTQSVNSADWKVLGVYFVATLLLGAFLGLSQRHRAAVTQEAQAAAQQVQAANPGSEWGMTLSDSATRPAGAPAGTVIRAVVPGGIADLRNVRSGDVLVGVNLIPARNVAETIKAMEYVRDHSGAAYHFVVWRKGRQFTP